MRVNFKRKVWIALSVAISLVSLDKESRAGVYVLPPDYENIYRSSLSDISSGTILYGQALLLRDYNGNTINSPLVWISGFPCYTIPKIACQNGRTASITTSVTTAYSQDVNTGRLYKMNGISVRPLDLGNLWGVCAVSNASTTNDRIDLSFTPCWTNSSGICFRYNLQYYPEFNSVSYTPTGTSGGRLSAPGAVITLQAQYKQYCR